MLDKRRIEEAKTNVRNYLADNLLKKEDFRKVVFDTYMKNHQESIALAENVYSNNLSNLWLIVISYYSMFYIANAVLYKIGYKVGNKISHKVTADSLIEFVRNKLKSSILEDYEIAKEEALEIAGTKADIILDSFDKEREKRSVFQYSTDEKIKGNKAKTSFERAKLFSTEMYKLLIDLK